MFRRLLAALAALVLVSCGGGGGASDTVGASGPIAASLGTEAMAALSPQSAAAKNPNRPATPLLVAQPAVVVNTDTLNNQTLRAVGATSDGGYEVAWIATGDFLYMQAYDDAGAPVGSQIHIQAEIIAPTVAANRMATEQSSLAILSDGSVVVLYTIARDVQLSNGFVNSVTGLYYQLFSKDGTLLVPETQVASQAFAGPKGPFLGASGVVALSDGGFVVSSALTHFSTRFGSVSTLTLYWFDAQGRPAGSPVVVGDFPQLSYGMVADAHGGLTLSTAHTSDAFETLYTVYHFDANHASTTVVAPRGRPVRLLPLADGYVLFAIGGDVTVQRLDSQGNPVGAASVVASLPVATSELADGTYVVIWLVNGVYTAQQFAADGTALGAAIPLDTNGAAPSLAALADPGFVIAWTGPGASGTDVYAQRFIEPPNVRRKDCLNQVKAQGLKGRERKAFVDACMA